MSANIFALFSERFKDRSQSVFLQLDDGSQLTFADIDALSGKMATLIRALGVDEGDRVVAQVEKTPAAVALYLACLRMGAIFVPLNVAYTPAELRYFLEDAAPQVFFCKTGFKARLDAIAIEVGVRQVIELGDQSDRGFWKDALAAAPTAFIARRDEDDLAAILYTSGTTGRPKGAMLSHGNLTSNAKQLCQLWQFSSDDVLLHALPIFHIHGLFVALHCALLSACQVQFLSRFEPMQVMEALCHNATVMMGVPTFYIRLLDEPKLKRDACVNMRLFISGSAPMTLRTHQEWSDRTGHQILERYGMSETGMISSNPYDGVRIAGTVGFPLPDVEVRIVGEPDKELESGEIGTIEVRGPNVFKGYWNKPELTDREFRHDGFFITGDLGFFDSENRLSIVGRIKDLIISGGYNVYPSEIEREIDAIEGVIECTVFGLPHPDLGEAVAAAIVMNPSADELGLRALSRELSEKLASFKHPKACFSVDSLPRNAMGKVQKHLLSERYANTFEEPESQFDKVNPTPV